MPKKTDKTIEELLASRKKNFPFAIVSIFSVIIIIIAALYFNFLSIFDDSAADPIIEREMVVAEKGNMANTLTSSGTAKAGAQSNLYSDSTGEVKEVRFSAGDEVRESEIIVTFDNDSALRNLNISKSNLAQAKITLAELENSPTESEKLNASQSKISAQQQLESSKQQLKNAEITLDKLVTPDISQVNSAEASVVSAEASVVSAEASVVSAEASVVSAKNSIVSSQNSIVSSQNSIDNAYVELLNSQKSYCDTVLTAPPFSDEKAPVCATSDLPLSSSNKTRLLDDIKIENDPITARITTTKALIIANSTYTNALSNLEIAKSNLETSESSALTSESSVLTSESSVLTSKSNLVTAKSNLESLLNPSERDVLQAQISIDTANVSVLSSQASLDSSIQAEKDILSGASEFQMSKQEYVIYSAELSVQENQKILDSLEVKSPRDGVIGSINVSEGDKVSANTLLGVISDITSISVDLAISESDLEGIEEGLYGIALFDSIPDQPYVVKISNVSIIPNINQGIVSYPVEAEILTTREIVVALPELAKYASGISGSSELSSFLLPQSGVAGPPGFDPSNLDLDCIRKALGDDFNIDDFSRETFQKIRESGCMEQPPSRDLGSSSMLGLVEQFAPSKMPAAGMGANVVLLKDLKENLVLVPSEAIQRKGRESYVKKVVGEDEIDVKIIIGESDGDRTSVIEGIVEGDLIIIEKMVPVTGESKNEQSEAIRQPQGPPGRGPGGFRGSAGN